MALINDVLAKAIIDRIGCIEYGIPAAITGGTNFFDRVTAAAPDDPSVVLTLAAVAHQVDLALAAGDCYNQVQAPLIDGLLLHLQKQPDEGETKAVYATIDAWLTARAFRVPVEFSALVYRRQGSYLTAANVYDSVKELGLLSMSGSGAGTFSDDDAEAYDTVHCGGNNVEAYVPATKTATNINITLALTLPAGTSEEKTITVNGAAGTIVAVGASTDIYTAVTGVTVNSGGANGEQVAFRTKLDRVLSL